MLAATMKQDLTFCYRQFGANQYVSLQNVLSEMSLKQISEYRSSAA